MWSFAASHTSRPSAAEDLVESDGSGGTGQLWFRRGVDGAQKGQAEAVLQAEPDNVPALCTLGFAAFRDGDPAAALSLLLRAADLGSDDPFLWRVVAKSYRDQWASAPRSGGNDALMHKAIDAFRASLDHQENKNDAEYRYHIALAYIDFLAFEGAAEVLGSVLLDFPLCPFLDRVILTAAVVLKQLLEYDECVRLLVSIIEAPPRPYLPGHVLFLLGRVYQLCDRRDLSIEAFTQSYRATLHAGLDTDMVDANSLGDGETRGAHVWSVHPRTWLSMGVFFHAQGDFLVAVDLLEEAVRRSAFSQRLTGGDPPLTQRQQYELWCELARGYDLSFRRREALAAAESAHAVWPFGVEAREMLLRWRIELWKLPFDTEHAALAVIQALARRALTRVRYLELRRTKLAAAAILQATGRRFIIRCWLARHREHLRRVHALAVRRREAAALRAQTWVRCRICARRLARLRAAARLVQRAVRGYAGRRLARRMAVALAQERARRRYRGACRLQTLFRGYACRRHLLRVQLCIAVQRLWRGPATRRRVGRSQTVPEAVSTRASGFPPNSPGFLKHWQMRLARSQALYSGKVQLLRRVAQVRRGPSTGGRGVGMVREGGVTMGAAMDETGDSWSTTTPGGNRSSSSSSRPARGPLGDAAMDSDQWDTMSTAAAAEASAASGSGLLRGDQVHSNWPLGAMSREEAFCALAEAHGDVAVAVQLLQDEEFATQVRRVCATLDVTKYLSFAGSREPPQADPAAARRGRAPLYESPLGDTRDNMVDTAAAVGDDAAVAVPPRGLRSASNGHREAGSGPPPDAEVWLPMPRTAGGAKQAVSGHGSMAAARAEGRVLIHQCTQRNCIQCSVSRVMGRERRRLPEIRGNRAAEGAAVARARLDVETAIADGWKHHSSKLEALPPKRGMDIWRQLLESPAHGGVLGGAGRGEGRGGGGGGGLGQAAGGLLHHSSLPPPAHHDSLIGGFEDVLKTSTIPGGWVFRP